MRYCDNCKRKVKGQKKFNWALFLLGFITFGIGSAVYLIYYLIKTPKTCPICGVKTKGFIWQMMHKEEVNES